MPSRKLTRLLTTPLARALVPAVEYRASAPAPYTPADEFAGGKNGWLYSGISGQSAFLQSAGGAAAGNGDPLGSVEDLSGNGNDILQSTGGAKPVNTVTGGINAIALSSSKFMDVTLASALAAYRTVVYVICIKATSPGEAYPLLMTTASGLDFVFNQTPGVSTATIGDHTSAVGDASVGGANAPYIVVYKKYDDGGTPTVNVKAYRLSNGSLLDDKTFATGITTATVTSISIGYPTPMPAHQIPFHMGIEGNIDTTNLLTYLLSTFGGWTP